MKKLTITLLFPVLTILIMLLSIAGPELFARYRDGAILGQIHTRASLTEGEGYRYTLSPGEKLYILSQSLDSQVLPESEQYALTRNQGGEGGGNGTAPDGTPGSGASGYGAFEGTYAFVLNHKGPSGQEITDGQIYETCNSGLDTLKEMGILPDTVRNVDKEAYGVTLYSAIDVLEPRNNVAVWKLELSGLQRNMDRENRLIEAYLDADTGKIYEFYARTPLSWEDLDPDGMAGKWAGYMGLEKPEAYETENPLMESTPYFRKYVFPGVGEQETVVTIGFYEGINELFLKISR